ncbi:conserved hypothetical protein [Ricinus communis]|uniref:Uncharacterized protein n=1 Tax=Ricinus communis TaxID=3988 RepID=B9RSF2_RICCO|nr:conserved hypothetical protein [Ricinus communis]
MEFLFCNSKGSPGVMAICHVVVVEKDKGRGVSRSVLEMNGEAVERAEPHIGLLQCGTKPSIVSCKYYCAAI